MNRYFIQISFKGTHFHGWQIQENALTIQQVLNKTMAQVLRESIETVGAGRTDTGVHARYFIAHFDSLQNDLHNNADLIFHLNQVLPSDIAIQKIFSVPLDAHARFDALERTYEYIISKYKNPLLTEYAAFIFRKLDVEKMDQAAKFLFEYTDYTSFSKLHTQVKTNECKITEAFWTESETSLKFTISADRFLRNMVRAIVGTLIDIGLGKKTPDQLSTIIESKNRCHASASAPAQGLYLTRIVYPASLIS